MPPAVCLLGACLIPPGYILFQFLCPRTTLSSHSTLYPGAFNVKRYMVAPFFSQGSSRGKRSLHALMRGIASGAFATTEAPLFAFSVPDDPRSMFLIRELRIGSDPFYRFRRARARLRTNAFPSLIVAARKQERPTASPSLGISRPRALRDARLPLTGPRSLPRCSLPRNHAPKN